MALFVAGLRKLSTISGCVSDSKHVANGTLSRITSDGSLSKEKYSEKSRAISFLRRRAGMRRETGPSHESWTPLRLNRGNEREGGELESERGRRVEEVAQ